MSHIARDTLTAFQDIPLEAVVAPLLAKACAALGLSDPDSAQVVAVVRQTLSPDADLQEMFARPFSNTVAGADKALTLISQNNEALATAANRRQPGNEPIHAVLCVLEGLSGNTIAADNSQLTPLALSPSSRAFLVQHGLYHLIKNSLQDNPSWAAAAVVHAAAVGLWETGYNLQRFANNHPDNEALQQYLTAAIQPDSLPWDSVRYLSLLPFKLGLNLGRRFVHAALLVLAHYLEGYYQEEPKPTEPSGPAPDPEAIAL